jgi:uncharacterized protein YndB with AHSA1/START domain
MTSDLGMQGAASAVPFVKQTRLIRVSRQAVYEAWTKAEVFAKWWGPADHVVSDVVLDVREGGTMSFRDDALPQAAVPPGFPRTMTGWGVYTEVVPGERLQFTMSASWSQGEASLVTVSLRDVEGGTEMTILHERISADMVPLYEQGWASTLGKLEALLTA